MECEFVRVQFLLLQLASYGSMKIYFFSGTRLTTFSLVVLLRL